MLRNCRLRLLPSFLSSLPHLVSTLFCLPPNHCSLPQMRALFIACSGFLPPTRRAPAFTSFSRKVALESEKDIDRVSGLSPSPGPGAPRRELDPDAALHTGSRLHAGPRPTPARLRRLLPSLSPGSLPVTSYLPLSLPLSPFLAFCVTLALSCRLSVLLSSFLSLPSLYDPCSVYRGVTLCPSIHIPLLPSPLPHPLLLPLPPP